MDVLFCEKSERAAPREGLGPLSVTSGVYDETVSSDAESEGSDRSVRDIGALVEAIKVVQQRMVLCEGYQVAGTIQEGRLLGELKAGTKPKTWGLHLKELEIPSRVASRLVKVGSWSRQIGLNESDLHRLAVDILKLERIACLDRAQLDRLFELIDCRKGTRPAVILAVKQILGLEDPSPEEEGVDRALPMIERMLMKLIAAIEGLGGAAPAKLCERLRTDLTAVLEKLPNP